MVKRHTKRKARSSRRRHRKTHHRRHPLKRKHRGGGRLDRLPLAANPAIEAAERIPDLEGMKLALLNLIAVVREEFRSNWDFKILMGHGELIPGPPAIVPPNTYVIFNSPAGCISLAENIAPMINLTVGTLDKFLGMLASHHVTQTGLFDTPSAEDRQALIAAGCYDESFFEEKKFFSGTTAVLGPTERKRTIYGPGEPVAEMTIRFANNPNEQLALGVFDLPFSREFYDKVMHSYDFLRTEEYRTAIAAAGQSEKTQQKLLESGLEKTYLADQANFGRRDGPNYKPDYVSAAKSWRDAAATDRTLSQIFSELPPIEEGKQRLLFIGSCRGITCKLPKLAKPMLARLARRASLDPNSMSSYTVGASTLNTLLKGAKAANNAKYTLGSAAPAAAVDPNQRMRDIVKGMLGKGPLPKPPATPQERKDAQAEITRQRAAAAAGSAPGSNNAFEGGPYA